MNGTLAPDRQSLGMGVVQPRKLKHVLGMLCGVERADHVGPFAGGRHGNRAPARAIRQALDRHDFDALRDVLLAGSDELRQGLYQARAGALFLFRDRLVVQAAGDADKEL
jgi:hypothetical protein